MRAIDLFSISAQNSPVGESGAVSATFRKNRRQKHNIDSKFVNIGERLSWTLLYHVQSGESDKQFLGAGYRGLNVTSASDTKCPRPGQLVSQPKSFVSFKIIIFFQDKTDK